VRRKGLVLAESLEGVGRHLDLVPLIAEELRQRCPRIYFVIDDEDSAASGHG